MPIQWFRSNETGKFRPVSGPADEVAECEVCGQTAPGVSVPSMVLTDDGGFVELGDHFLCASCRDAEEAMEDAADEMEGLEPLVLGENIGRVVDEADILEGYEEVPVERQTALIFAYPAPEGRAFTEDEVAEWIGDEQYRHLYDHKRGVMLFVDGVITKVDLREAGKVAHVWFSDRRIGRSSSGE